MPKYVPQILRDKNPHRDHPLWDEFYDRAYFCLNTGISPEFYDTLTEVELKAWVEAYNNVTKEQEKGA